MTDRPEHRPTQPTAVGAVVRAMAAQLAALDPDRPDAAEQLGLALGVAEDLLRRAALDDAVTARRVEGTARDLDPADPGVADRLLSLDDSGAGTDLRRLVGELRAVEIGPVPATDRMQVPDPGHQGGVSSDDVAAYLRARGDGRRPVRVTTLTGGFSKRTVLVELTGPGGSEEIVLRQVVAGRVADTLSGEYAVLAFAGRNGLPVPTPLWLDTGGGLLGGPLFATRRMPGRTVGTVTGPTSDAGAPMVRDLAVLLGRLHALPVPADLCPPRSPMGTPDQMLAAIDERERIVGQAAEALPDTPGLALHRILLAWLRHHLPAGDEGPVLVHGDASPANLLVEDGRVSALLDWELAHRGRPSEDLAYVRPAVEKLLPWGEFVDAYRRAGGPPVREDELRFFTVWQDVWRATSCLRLRTGFVLEPTRLSDGVSGLLLRVRFLESALLTAFDGGR